jgi:ribosome-associated translation inhibitor RaiA
MEIRITSQDLGLSSRCRQFIEKKMRVIRRFIGDDVSAQIFLRRNAGVVPGKRFSARARFTLAQDEILGFCTDAQLNGAVRKLIAKFASQARNRKRRRVEAVRRINKFSNQNRGPSEPAVGTDIQSIASVLGAPSRCDRYHRPAIGECVCGM